MNTSDNEALQLFSELLEHPAPSGREERISATICRLLAEAGYSPETDPAGNVIVRIDGRSDAQAMMLAAHMDEIGMVVTGINADGSLRVARSGGLYPFKLGESPVTVVGDHGDITAIVSMGSTHTKAAATQSVTWEQTKLITGLSHEALTEVGVRPGSTVVPVREGRGPIVFGDPQDPLVAGWTFDDRMGCVAQIRLLRRMKENNLVPNRPMIVTFTVHEEGGAHGAKVVAHRERPEIFIAVDGCPMPPGTDLALDGRPCTWSKDAKAHYDQRLVRAFCDAATKAGTGMQTVVLDNAFSDASAVYDTGGAPRVGIVGHVRENSHGYEVARLSVFDNLLKVLVQFIEDIE